MIIVSATATIITQQPTMIAEFDLQGDGFPNELAFGCLTLAQPVTPCRVLLIGGKGSVGGFGITQQGWRTGQPVRGTNSAALKLV